jgi:hypothetical protein
MHGKKILLDGDTPALIRQDMNTNGIGAEFLEALKLRLVTKYTAARDLNRVPSGHT